MSVRKYLGQTCEGTIKSFGPDKGYGFITGDGFSEDVFVSFKLCPNLVGGDLTGQRVIFVPVENASKKGSYEAQTCELIDGAQGDSSASLGKWIDGTVKSWSPTNGWGFLTSNRIAGDIFISKKLCPVLNTYPLDRGMVVRVKVGESASNPGSFEAMDLEIKMGKGMGKGMVMGGMGMGMGGMGMHNMQQMAMSQFFMGMKGGGKGGYMGLLGGGAGIGGMRGPIGKKLTGIVKSFNPAQGWGFLTSHAVDGDIFVSDKTSPGLSVLMQELVPGKAVRFTLGQSKSKPGSFEATDVSLGGGGGKMSGKGGYGMLLEGRANAISSPYGKPKPSSSQKASQTGRMSIGQSVTGTIKSFAAVKGWGFVNSDSFADDCFFNIKNNPQLNESMAQLQAGQPVSFTVQESTARPGALEAVDIVTF